MLRHCKQQECLRWHGQVKATAGDTHLGGEDFDNRMVKHFTAVRAPGPGQWLLGGVLDAPQVPPEGAVNSGIHLPACKYQSKFGFGVDDAREC